MGFEFALLSDPDHSFGRAMGVEREPDDRLYGIPRRVTFLIDPEGTVRWAHRVDREKINSHADETFLELRSQLGG